MDLSIPTALRAFSATGAAVKALTAWGKRTRGNQSALILELRDNLIYLDLVAHDGVELAEVVDKLSVDEYKRLSREGFSFNSLKRKKVANLRSLTGTSLAAWKGKTTGNLVESIYIKIRRLKIQYPHGEYPQKMSSHSDRITEYRTVSPASPEADICGAHPGLSKLNP